jgi:hypothetical protein
VGDPVFWDQLRNPAGIDLAQANADAGRGSDGSRKTPTVAMEHWQRPEIDWMLPEIAREDIADGVEICAKVMGGLPWGCPSCPKYNSAQWHPIRPAATVQRVSHRRSAAAPLKALSSTSMTNGLGPLIRVSASDITPVNSGSARMIVAPP